MTDVQFHCPHCNQLLTLDVSYAGAEVTCPTCGNNLLAPSATPAAGVGPVTYAGFWRRLIAMLIDSVILIVPGAVAGGIVGFFLGFAMTRQGADLATIEVVCTIAGNLLGISLNWLYFTLMESSSKQGTLGKMVMDIKVTDLEGRRISYLRANGRYWGKILSFLLAMIGFLMAGFTRKKQALHDMMAGCLVVRR